MTRDDYLEALIAILPGFSKYWKSYSWLNKYDSNEHTVYDIFTDASMYVCEELEKRHTLSSLELFEFVERVVAGNSQDASNAAMTCFLENILNRTDSTINPDQWIPFIGPESREFCKGWDKWTGCRTKGLWTEAEIAEFHVECERLAKNKGT